MAEAKKRKRVRADLPRERTVHLAEHEIMLGFWDDGGAQAFDLWWRTKGEDAFARWCATNDHEGVVRDD